MMKKRNQVKDKRRMQEWQMEIEMHEERKKYEADSALRLRKERLEVKRLERLERGQQRKNAPPRPQP